MKTLKIYLAVAFFLAGGLVLQAQEALDAHPKATSEPPAHEELSQDSTQLFFDYTGAVNRITTTPVEVAAKIIKINPRIDDVVWSKSVLRVVDLRELQNQPLYYPMEDLAEDTQKNLFAIIFSHILDGTLMGYKSQTNMDQTFVPKFKKENEFKVDEFLQANDLTFYESIYDKINYLTPGIVKYYIQEVWYFNKATSTMHNKILAIAPLYDENYNTRAGVRTGVFFWVPFDNLRPFLQEEFIKITGRNTSPLTDFDNFLVSRQFNSYIMKDYDVLSYDIDRNLTDPNRIREEQERVELEILNFDQDLWEY